MQDVDSFLMTAFEQGYTLEGSARVVAEWNYNNLFNPTVTNPPDDQNWIYAKDYFPLSSISSGFRPNTGIFYALTDEAYTDDGQLSADRYYCADTNANYQYWVCPTPSAESERGAEFGSGLPMDFAVDRGVVIVDYGQYLNMNKLSVTLNLGCTPTEWTISVFEQVSNDWIDIANPTIDPLTGKCEVWWNGTAWIQTQQLNESIFQRISKVKINVVAVDQKNSRLEVIELAGKREIELTSRLEEYTVNASLDSHDYLHPIGRMSANDGSLVLSNSDLKINHDDPTSDFFGTLEGWCQYRTYITYDMTPYGGSAQVNVRTGTMYSNDWQQTNEDQYSVELFDIFKILQSMDCPPVLLEGLTIGKIISIILDMAGVDTYSFENADFDVSNTVKYFWTDGKQKVFQVLDDLCNSYQAALFVDELGIIRLLTRNDITVQEGEDPVWEFAGVDDEDKLADIVSLKKKYETVVNKVKINYKKREAKVDAQDITEQPLTSSLWEADDTVVLRSSPLTRRMINEEAESPTASADIWISPTNVKTWPYSGKANIDGELIEYDGKGYVWWNHTTGSPVYNEQFVKNEDERKALDRQSYLSYTSGTTIGGISADPTKQNGFSGRLVTKTRDVDGSGQRKSHFIGQSYGWYAMNLWHTNAKGWGFPGKYFEPGGNLYNYNNVRNWTAKTNWTEVQGRCTVKDSVLTVNNATNNSSGTANFAQQSTVLVNDVGNTECREFGTRLRHRGGTKGKATIAFYMSNASGYDNEGSQITEAINATRCYLVNVCTTEYVEATGRTAQLNEISVQVKNGDSLTFAPSSTVGLISGQIKIDPDKWYDIDIVFTDGVGDYYTNGGASLATGRSVIQVYVDGAFAGNWVTSDNIRPTSLFALGAKDLSIVDFEDFYATDSPRGQLKYVNDDLFDGISLRFPAGSNISTSVTLPVDGGWDGQGVLSLATCLSNATIHEIELATAGRAKVVQVLGTSGLTLKPDQRWSIQFSDLIETGARYMRIRYTSTNPISMALEYSLVRNYPYGTDTEPVAPASSYYDLTKGGYLSSKRTDHLNLPQVKFVTNYTGGNVPVQKYLDVYYEDFGAVVHEVRDFDVELSNSPAKGIGVFSSNENTRVIDYKYSPTRGYFTLANVSHRNEIVNGTEELDDSNSIDYSLMLYGYALEDKGDFTETVQNDLSIKRRGILAEDLDATWIFTKEEAQALGAWIVDHWSDAMDSVQLSTFCSSHIQIGDKVTINLPNAAIDSDWIWMVSDKATTITSEGLDTSITVRRVQ